MTMNLPMPGSWPNDSQERTENDNATSPPSASELPELPDPTGDGEGTCVKNLEEMAIRLEGNPAFKQWRLDNPPMNFGMREARGLTKSNPPLRRLEESPEKHKCFKCADPEEAELYREFRDVVRLHLASTARKQNSSPVHADLNQHEDDTSLSRPGSERDITDPVAVELLKGGDNPDHGNGDEHESGTSVGISSREGPAPREFPLFILPCDHVVCQVCLLRYFRLWLQNLYCPVCRLELVATKGFYRNNMMIDASTTFSAINPNLALDPMLVQKALLVSRAFESSHEVPMLVVTARTCEKYKDMIVAHLSDRLKGPDRHSDDGKNEPNTIFSHDERSESRTLPQNNEAFQKILSAVDKALNLVFFRPNFSGEVPCRVSVRQPNAAMLRQAREAAKAPIISLCRKSFALDLCLAGLNFDSSNEEIFEKATTCPGTRMGKVWDVCVELVDLTVAWLVWRQVTADPEYTKTLAQVAMPVELL